MRRILDRYILREVTLSWISVTGILLVILLTNELARVLGRAADNQYPPNMVLALIGLGAVQNLNILLPIGLLLGVMLAFGRLYHDSEMAAALACGVGPVRVYGPVVLLAVLVTGLLAWLSLSEAPDAMRQVLNLRSAALRAGQYTVVTPGRFRSFEGGTAVLYAQSANPDGTLSNVFVERNRDGRVEVALAVRARHDMAADGHSLTITLYNGERFVGTPGSAQFRMMRFAEHTIPVQIPAPSERITDMDAAPTGDLLRATDLKSRAELHWRIALPVMCLVLTLVAVPLSRLRPRQGRYARVWIAVVLYLLYSNLVSSGKIWLERGVIPEGAGLWWTHVIVILVALFVVLMPKWAVRLRHREASA
ncbi:MAG TPA: LPS export ABC transporter permease LptF [Steroidobacteraceae bacterium]|nr:LPS export ABC transporter permease LptF [Steroidobacteraceae bacterium]